MASAPGHVTLCGDILDTLGSSLYALQAFLDIAVLLHRTHRSLPLVVALPELPSTAFGRRQAPGMPLAQLLDTTTLQRRLAIDTVPGGSVNCSRYHMLLHKRAQSSEGNFTGPPLQPVAVQPFLSSFALIERLFQQRHEQNTTVLVQLQQFGAASCAHATFPARTREVLSAMTFADTVTADAPSCAYAYLRHGFARSTENEVRPRGGLSGARPRPRGWPQAGRALPGGLTKVLVAGRGSPEETVCANCPLVNVPLPFYAGCLARLLHALGLTCLVLNYPDKSGAAWAAAELQRAAHGTAHPFTVRSTAASHEQQANFHAMRSALEAPLLVSEASTLWADWCTKN